MSDERGAEREVEPGEPDATPSAEGAAPEPTADGAAAARNGVPSDLPDDFTVALERVFHGPLDLLLHLVREQEVEIHEVKITDVIDGYMQHLRALEELDLEVAGEFLVMAATLMAIKSRSLLPTEDVDLEDELDPEDELIQRLIEYRRFKSAAEDLSLRADLREELQPRGWQGEVRASAEEPTLDLGDLTPWDLLSSFSRLMREVSAEETRTITRDIRPLRWYVETLVERIREAGRFDLRTACQSLGDGLNRASLIGTFCALLELVRLEVVEVQQDDGAEDDVVLVFREDADAAERLAGVQFDDEAEEAGAEGDAPVRGA